MTLCPICKSRSTKHYIGDDVKLKCVDCTHTWLVVSERRTKEFHVDEVTWEYKHLDVRDGYHKARIAQIGAAIKLPPQSALDVGCGDGRFLQLLEAGESIGIDINSKIPEDIEYIQGSFLDIKLDRQFDVVTSFHSMEHVYGCVGFFKKLLSLSSKLVAVEVPCGRKVGQFSGHVHGFNLRSFKTLIQRHAEDFSTVTYIKNIQGASILWIGKRVR